VIRTSTLNGAIYLDLKKEIGSVTVGRNANRVVINGDPLKQTSDSENVEIAFKDRMGYDSPKLLSSALGGRGARCERKELTKAGLGSCVKSGLLGRHFSTQPRELA
jgi:hypothetical protein